MELEHVKMDVKQEEKKVEVEQEQKVEAEQEQKVEQKKENSIKDLPGVGPATIEKLEAVGFSDLLAIAVATPRQLIDATGMGEPAAKKLIATARSSLDMGFMSGEDILEKRNNIFKISTGLKIFDDLLGGGFETGTITEIFGEYGSGKTQIAHLLAVYTVKQKKDAYVVYVDTENTFRPERIIQFAKGVGIDPKEVLKKIKVARAYNSDHQMLLAEKVEDLIRKENLNVKLVIIDSLTSHFRAEFIGRGTLAERQQKLNKHMHVLSRIADAHNLCVYVTNQVMTRPDQFFGDPTEAIGGHIVAHNSQTRMYLRKGKKGSRVVKLVDSPHLADGEVNFFMCEEGLKEA